MVIGARRSPTALLSPQMQLQAYVTYDPVSRRAVRFIETIVPTLSSDDEIPADIYYAWHGAGLTPSWVSAASGASNFQWDATDQRFYAALDAVNDCIIGNTRNAWPTGPCGTAQSFEPKNGNVVTCVFEFRARFNNNQDYATAGIGLCSRVGTTPGPAIFDTATDHFIQVLRNTSNWELGTCDGTTISQTSASGGDGSLHDFRVEWDASEVRLYVDETLKVTKTTNRPTQPLALLAVCANASKTMDVMGKKIYWKAAA